MSVNNAPSTVRDVSEQKCQGCLYLVPSGPLLCGLPDLTCRSIHGLIQMCIERAPDHSFRSRSLRRFGWGGARRARAARRVCGRACSISSDLPCPAGLRLTSPCASVPAYPRFAAAASSQELRGTLRRGCERGDFRVLHYSVQTDHVHLLVESAGKERARLRDEVDRGPARACDPARLCPGGAGSRRPLSPPRPADAARGQERARLRPAERASSSPEARRGSPRRPSSVVLDAASSARWFDGWASGMPQGRHDAGGRTGSRAAAHLARPGRLAPARADRPCRAASRVRPVGVSDGATSA